MHIHTFHLQNTQACLGCTKLSANLTGSLKFLIMFLIVSSGRQVTSCVVFSICSQRISIFLSEVVSFIRISISLTEKNLFFFLSPSNLTKISQAPDCMQWWHMKNPRITQRIKVNFKLRLMYTNSINTINKKCRFNPSKPCVDLQLFNAASLGALYCH